jgi:hypothetical protein
MHGQLLSVVFSESNVLISMSLWNVGIGSLILHFFPVFRFLLPTCGSAVDGGICGLVPAVTLPKGRGFLLKKGQSGKHTWSGSVRSLLVACLCHHTAHVMSPPTPTQYIVTRKLCHQYPNTKPKICHLLVEFCKRECPLHTPKRRRMS